ncbi:MAG: TolB family protein, partial [Steroidobacterales bacterium]
ESTHPPGFNGFETELSTELYVIKSDGTELRRQASDQASVGTTSWSSDGQWIAIANARGGFKDESILHPLNPQPYGNIFVMRADGSDVRQLTDDQFEDSTPAFMPTSR